MTGQPTVLILGGTGEARDLAARLVAADVPVISSLAGAVSRPRLPDGEVRIGGFGGAAGLAEYLASQGISQVVDATHPFAATISAHAVWACQETSTPLLRLERPGWSAHPDAASWVWVDDHAAAASAAAAVGGPVLLTTGRQHLSELLPGLGDQAVIARVVDPPEIDLHPGWTVLRARGPFDLESERNLLQTHQIRALVTKDSGGTLTVAKLQAAAELGVTVIVVRRPARPEASGTPQVTTPDEAVIWLLAP